MVTLEAYDPLADAPPPRYAVESDDEDEYNPSRRPPTGSEQPPEVKVEFKSIYDIPTGRPLVFTSGEAGVSWAKIVNLGEQQAGIYVNNLPVGLLFRPSWTSAVIVVSESETRTRLPLFAMTTYTVTIIERLQPTSVAILDSYPTKVYISPRVIPPDSAPIRYLSVGKRPVLDSRLELFAPPNLMQSTTASLLNNLFLLSISGYSTRDVTVILLPSPKVPLPPPMALDGKGAAGDLATTNWIRETLERAHKWLLAIVGEEADESSLSAQAESAIRPPISTGIMTISTLGKVGEGGMYM